MSAAGAPSGEQMPVGSVASDIPGSKRISSSAVAFRRAPMSAVRTKPPLPCKRMAPIHVCLRLIEFAGNHRLRALLNVTGVIPRYEAIWKWANSASYPGCTFRNHSKRCRALNAARHHSRPTLRVNSSRITLLPHSRMLSKLTIRSINCAAGIDAATPTRSTPPPRPGRCMTQA